MKINYLSKYILLFILFYNNNILCEDAIFTNNLLDSIALSESSNKEVLVIFTASWCKYCSIMKKDLENNKDILDNKIICYINFDENQDLVRTYNVKTIPDYFILKNKIETKRKVGYTNKVAFIKWIKNE